MSIIPFNVISMIDHQHLKAHGLLGDVHHGLPLKLDYADASYDHSQALWPSFGPVYHFQHIADWEMHNRTIRLNREANLSRR